ncbi:MAG: hypothetical protein JWP13_692, partial [Candidatus Saccharibacteria bacterium]|nr:hypothetical protein [Candidatus Saccharibacteria bacterium]
MRKHMKSSGLSKSAVPVSYNLQLATIVAASAATLLQFSFILPLIGRIPFANESFAHVLSFIGYNSLPIVVFLLAYFSSSRYPNRLNRWFIAVVKSVVVISLFGFLQGIRSMATTLYYRFNQPVSGPPPSWMTTGWIDAV